MASDDDMPRPFLSAAMNEATPELIKEFQERWAKVMADWDGRLVVVEPQADLREQIAFALERMSNRHDQDAERYADERSSLLKAQAEALWDAARMVRDGEEGGDGD